MGQSSSERSAADSVEAGGGGFILETELGEPRLGEIGRRGDQLIPERSVDSRRQLSDAANAPAALREQAMFYQVAGRKISAIRKEFWANDSDCPTPSVEVGA